MEYELIKKKKKKSHKKDFFSISILIIGITLIITSNIINNKYEEEMTNLQQEVINITKKVEENNINDLDNKIKKNITTNERLIIEKNIENYYLDLLVILKKVNNLDRDQNINNLLNMNNLLNEDLYSKLDDKINEILLLKDELINYQNKKFEIEIDVSKRYYDFYKDFIDRDINIDLYKVILDQNIELIKDLKNSYNYLLNNKKYYFLNDHDITFKREKEFLEYQKIYMKLLDNYKGEMPNIKLNSDKEAPIITASDLTFTVGNKVNLNQVISCYDNVDLEVNCNISGNYDFYNIGEYDIAILASDMSGNIASKNIKLNIKEIENYDKPYKMEILKNENVVIIYKKGLDGNYTDIEKVFICSTGRSGRTPSGIFYTEKGYIWGSLMGGVYGQYSTRIVGNVLFHSVPYYTMNKNDLEWHEYNKLGSQASAGCVRLTVNDAKWIYDNIDSGTMVKIYNGKLPNGVSKPLSIIIDSENSNRGWDPTDPDPLNPWNKN